jgi:hypothetical protein
VFLNIAGSHFWNTLVTEKRKKRTSEKNSVFCVSVTPVSAFEPFYLLP